MGWWETGAADTDSRHCHLFVCLFFLCLCPFLFISSITIWKKKTKKKRKRQWNVQKSLSKWMSATLVSSALAKLGNTLTAVQAFFCFFAISRVARNHYTTLKSQKQQLLPAGCALKKCPTFAPVLVMKGLFVITTCVIMPHAKCDLTWSLMSLVR